LLQPAIKCPRLDNDVHHPSSPLLSESASAPAAPTLTVKSDRMKKSKKISEKGKGKARTASDRDHSTTSFTTPSTSQRVDKITPAVAIVELHGSIKNMTQAIVDASKAPESFEDKAAVRTQEAVRLVQERNDGLSLTEKANLIVFFGNHVKEADMYLALNDDELRQAVVRQWIGHL
jgi:hypothetical protein